MSQKPMSSGSMNIGMVDTSGSRQQVYETNLLSLFYFRAAQDISIEQLEFVKNMKRSSHFPPFSDIRLKIKIKWHHMAITVFIQALHKTNNKHFLEIDVGAYFETYMKIKHMCNEKQYLLIVYTNANVDTPYTDASARSGLSAKLNDILDTGGKVKCLNNEENIEYLTKKTVKDQITSLAKTIARYIDNKHNFQRMMKDELVLRYHVILALEVFDISDVQTQIPVTAPQHRIASFRYDFLINEEEYMMLFKITLFLEFIKERKLNSAEIQLYLSEFMDDPTATRLSKVMGTAVTYNNGQLEFDKQSTEAFRSQATDYKAVALAATAVLSTLIFKVPAAFGNKDLTISGSDAEIENRICCLASTMKKLLDKCDDTKTVTIDESLGNGFVELDGGVAGAIGNIFVLDENTKLMKITDNWESLNTLAQRLYKKLKDVIHNLHEYTFCFKVDKFPELLIDNYGKKMAIDFLNNFLVYYNQAEENVVQQILKSEIEDIQRNETNYFQIKNDALFLRHHNEIQEIWRMLEQPESNHTQGNIDLFRKSKDAILVDPLISLISELYFNKIKQYDYTFTEHAVSALNLFDRPSSSIIVTENCVLTAVKVLQHLNDEEEPYVVLDVEYIAGLPANDRNALRAELKDADGEDLVLICDKVDKTHEKTLENIANVVQNKPIIVISNQKTLEILHKYFPEADSMLHDKKFSLIDVDIQSQKSILNDATAVFPGVEISLGVLLRGWPRTGQAYASQNSRHSTVCRNLQPAARASSFSNMSATFKRSAGTAGIRGQLYETKLISLILYRAKHDDSIEQFQLASNMDSKEVGAFDDICFKAKVKGLTKPLIAFIQSKHKDDSDDSPKVVLMKYFISYLKIREQFKSQHDSSSMFYGEFQDTYCYFVIYTNGKEQHSLDDDAVEDEDYLAKLNELIATGVKRPYKHKADVAASLYEKLAMDKTISLAKRIATFIGKEISLQDLLSDQNNIILLYHVFLAQKVFEISEIKTEGHRVATFRQDFFNTKDEYLTLFKHTLLQEILNKRKLEPSKINNLLSEFIAEPTDVTKLSNLIGTVVRYNNGQLELVEKYSKYFNQQMRQALNCRSTVNEAVELVAKDIVTKVPAAFGNKDLTLRGSDTKKERRIKHLKSKIIEILNKSKPNNVIVMDESIEKGLLELNGGLAGAIGNIFVPDDNKKYMKITDSCESLGPYAKSLYTKLVNEIHNLHEYRFYFRDLNVPRFSLGPSDYDKSLAREFLNKLLFYSKQAEENKVEEILKSKIEDYQLDHTNYFQAKTDAMFLQYHERIQKWWMLKHQAPYLTKDSQLFEEAIDSIIKDPLMSSINLIYMSKLQHFEYTFHEDAVSSLHLQDHSIKVIITKNYVLTVVKVLQHFKNKDHAVLDLEYIVKLPTNDRNALCAELKKTKDHKALIFVCDKLQNKSQEIKTFEIIGKAVLNKKTIILTNQMTHETLKEYFPRADSIVQDDKNSLIDMSEASQKSILESTVVFQGAKLKLNLILDDESKAYVNGDVLNTIVSKGTITINKLTVDTQYNEVKHLYVDRCVQQTKANTSLPLKTLFDIEDDVVLVTAEPGMGKSTLLTHLSLETKIKHPDVWIIRVNLLEYSREFSKWKQENTAINTLETMKFMCQVMLGEKLDGKGNNVEFELEEDNGVVNLTQCTGDQWTEFELKLFLYFYNKRNIIFVFDGFDEICPHYMHEVIKCIKTVNSHNKNHKIWVTSRSYTEIQQCLQRAFGEPYEIEHLSYSAKSEYLMKIWQSNLILKELDKLQLQNIHDFLKFVTEPQKQELQLFELPLQEIYIDAVNYIINEIKTTSIPLWTFNDNYDDRFYKLEEKDIFERSIYEDNSDKNPLHIFLRALFVINRIKDVSHSTNKWNRDVNTFTFYEQYLETKLKRIRFQGKNQMDIYKPDIRIAYEKELAEFIAKHKKMAAYAIFNQDINKLFSMKDVEEIKETIKSIEKGGEKTGLIYSVANISAIEIPIFIHMTFAEYFAVEYICDLLKQGDGSEKQHQLMNFIFNVMFSASNFENIRTIFDYKMKIDVKVMSVIKDHDEVIFNLLFEQGKAHSEYLGNVQTNISEETSKKKENAHFWPPFEALRERLHNFRCLFVAIFERYINENNLSEFLDLVHGINLLPNAVLEKWDELVVCVFNKVKDYKLSSLNCVLTKNFGLLSRSRDYDEISSEEIIELIREDYLKEYNTLKENGHFQRLERLYQM